MYGYKCPDCGANLDPGEKCTCQNENKDKDEEGNQNDMDKNEILKELELQAELNQASIAYLENLIKIADNYEKDRGEIVNREIKALFITATRSEFKNFSPATEKDNEV